jgi:hypothetical protein
MNKKETLDLLKSIITDDSEPYFSKEYFEKTFLGIKTCKNCGVKDFDFDDYCKSCDRDNKIDELGIK